MEIEKLVRRQRRFFGKGCTMSRAFRIQALDRLEKTIKKRSAMLCIRISINLHLSLI